MSDILEKLELVALVRYERVIRSNPDGGAVVLHEWRFRVRTPDGVEHDLEKILWSKANAELPLLDEGGSKLGVLVSRQDFEQRVLDGFFSPVEAERNCRFN